MYDIPRESARCLRGGSDSRVQVYYFYSYGTAAWLGELNGSAGDGWSADDVYSAASRTFDRFADHDCGPLVA